MAQYFEIHPDNPQNRLLTQATQLIAKGGILAVPTDSSYALVCHLDDKAATDHLRKIRGVDEKHNFTLLCANLKELSQFAVVDNVQYRILKVALPGPFTFVLNATRDVPRRVCHPSRKTIGLRIPDHRALQMLIELHRAPLLCTTLIPADETKPLNDPQKIRNRYENKLAGIIESGTCPMEPTTVVDLSTPEPKLLRQGRGNLNLIGL